MTPSTGTTARAAPSRRGLSPLTAAALSVGAVALTAFVARRHGPTPDHPDTLRWYRRLEKPGFTPPDPVFGAGWGVAETLLAGGYRLMRLPAGPARNLALASWALNFATIAGRAKLFFGRRDLDASLADVAVELTAAVGYVAAASKVDGKAAATGALYAAWAAFGAALDEEAWRRNRGREPGRPSAPRQAGGEPRVRARRRGTLRGWRARPVARPAADAGGIGAG